METPRERRERFEKAALENDGGQAFLDAINHIHAQAPSRRAVVRRVFGLGVATVAVAAATVFFYAEVVDNIRDGNWGMLATGMALFALLTLVQLVAMVAKGASYSTDE